MQRLEDLRAYKLMCCHIQNPPPAEDLFPSLRPTPELISDDEEFDDEIKFRQVTANFIQR
jgi:hypothetical protein